METFVDHHGEERRLGLLPITGEGQALRAQKQTYGDYLASIGQKIYTRSEWKPVKMPAFNPKGKVNQLQTSACVAASKTAGAMKLMQLLGMTFQQLSWSFMYSLINHGQDAGAYITASMSAGEKYGFCLESECPYPNYFSWMVPKSAYESGKKRLTRLDFPVYTIEELITAIMKRHVIQFGVRVARNFEAFDDGVAGVAYGQANHSMHAAGFKAVGNRVAIEAEQTWNPNWGPYGDGRVFIREDAIDLSDCYAMVDIQQEGN